MEYLELLKRIVEFEEEHMEEWKKKEQEWKEQYNVDWKVAWTWRDVGIHPVKLNKLVLEGWLEVIYKSRRATSKKLRSMLKGTLKLRRLRRLSHGKLTYVNYLKTS